MQLWIKYDTVAFRAAETCQDCHLFSDGIAGKWQFKSGGLSLSWQVFNLCSISARRRALFSIHCFAGAVFHLWGFVVFSLSHCPSLLHHDFVSRLPQSCTATVKPELGMHTEQTRPTLTAPQTSIYPPQNAFVHLLTFSPTVPSFLPSRPYPSDPLLLHPMGLESLPLFLTSVLFSD